MLLVTVLYQSNNSTFYRPGKQGLFISAQQTNQSSALHQERRVFKRTKSCATWNRDSPAVTPPWEIKEQQKVPSYSSCVARLWQTPKICLAMVSTGHGYFSGRSLGHWTKPRQEAWDGLEWIETKQQESGNSWQPCLWLRKPINTNPTKSLSSQRGFKYYCSVRFSSNMIEIWTKWLCLNPPAAPLFYAKR